MTRKEFNVLFPDENRIYDQETVKYEALLQSFLRDGFSYEAMSENYSALVVASAEMLHVLLPWIIEEMLRRGDTESMLADRIVYNIDPNFSPELKRIQERIQKLVAIADKDFAETICRFLKTQMYDFAREEDARDVLAFWQNKLRELEKADHDRA